MPLLDHFGIVAPLYEKFISPAEPERLCELLELPVSGPLLDAGGGTGRVAQHLRGQGGPVIVADFSQKMLLEACRKEGIFAVRAPAETLPFEDETFPRIIMVDALHHVHSQVRTAAELWRVLQPGGRIVIEEPDVHRWGVKVMAVLEKLALMRSRILSPERIAALFAGFPAKIRVLPDGFEAYVVVEKPV